MLIFRIKFVEILFFRSNFQFLSKIWGCQVKKFQFLGKSCLYFGILRSKFQFKVEILSKLRFSARNFSVLSVICQHFGILRSKFQFKVEILSKLRFSARNFGHKVKIYHI